MQKGEVIQSACKNSEGEIFYTFLVMAGGIGGVSNVERRAAPPEMRRRVRRCSSDRLADGIWAW